MKAKSIIRLLAAVFCISCGCSNRLDVNYEYTVMPTSPDHVVSESDKANVGAILDRLTARYGMHEFAHGPANVIKIYSQSSIGFLLHAEDETNRISISMVGAEPRLKKTATRVQFISELESGLRDQFGERFRRDP